MDHFDINVPDAYCVYAPLAVASLSDVITAYTAETTAIIALLADYLNGLVYLHDKNSTDIAIHLCSLWSDR